MLISEYSEFAELLRSDKRIVFLCGAGLSMSLGCHGLSWSRWLSQGCNYLQTATAKNLSEMLLDTTSTGLIQAASFCLSSLKSEDRYIDFMDATVGGIKPLNRILSSALASIARAGDLFATTNYDMLIEEVTGQKTTTYNNPASILNVLNGKEQAKIIHIHGAYDKISQTDDIIADNAQYANIIENQGAQFIQNLISTYPLVIIGCGATVDDPNLKGFLSFATDKLGLNILYYYLYCGDTPPSDLSGNMMPVCYGDNYDALNRAIADIAQYRLKHRYRDRELIRVNPYVPIRSDSSAYSRFHYTSSFMRFVGRGAELLKLDRFLEDDRHFSWWAVIGDGGIGKSRLVLEWLKELPADWYGFFGNTSGRPEAFGEFIPFNNTVIVFDYVNANTGKCAHIIDELKSAFDDGIYKLRIVFLERYYIENKDNWLDELEKQLNPRTRMTFSGATYQKTDQSILTPLIVSPMSVNDQTSYVAHYLEAYLSSEIGCPLASKYLCELPRWASRIVEDFRKVFREEYRRPLFLSIYTEVWVCKDGGLGIATVRDLLSVFMEKEESQWLLRFNNDKRLLKSYQKLLALASATDMVCLIDPAGIYQNDADVLLQFVSDESRLGGKGTSFDDLFIYQELARDYDDIHGMLEEDDESAIPNEERIRDEIERIKNDPNRLRLNENGEPVLVTMLQPLYPDIVRAFIVDWYISEAYWTSFAELARDQTTIEFSLFLSHAIEDFPDTASFITMAMVKPKDEDRFGYYITMLSSLRVIDDFGSIVDVLMSSPVSDDFGLWESELWRRIAIVLSERCAIESIYSTGQKYFSFAEQRLNIKAVIDAIPDVSEAFFVELHNAERIEEFACLVERLTMITEKYPQDGYLATCCIEAYQRLAVHYARGNDIVNLRTSWDRMIQYSHRFPGDVYNGKVISDVAEQLCDWFLERGAIGRVTRIIGEIGRIYSECKTADIAEVLAVLEVNSYFRCKRSEDKISEMKSSKACVFELYEAHPDAERVILAYSSLLADAFMDRADFHAPVSIGDCERFEEWKNKCPNHRLEMSEHYCRVLFARCAYLLSIDEESEARSIANEMRGIGRELSHDFGDNDVSDMVEFMEEHWALF